MDYSAVLESIQPFIPNSSGDEREKFNLALSGNKNFISNILSIASVFQYQVQEVVDIESMRSEDTTELKKLLDSYGSDKANSHNYEILYANIFKNRNEIKDVLEIGMGTNNTNVLSNMGVNGKPGASLRAFRDYLPNANIYGADIDREILFEEERITTYFVDQLRPATIYDLFNNLPNDLDLVIDDGLHSPEANINVFTYGISKIKVGGWMVIEDIPDQSVELWKIVSLLIPINYETHLIKADKGNLFAVNRLD